jgi:hypothetical protein
MTAQPPSTLEGLHVAAEHATTATEFAAIAALAISRFGTVAATRILATRWPLVTGSRTAVRLLDRLIDQTSTAPHMGRDLAVAAIGGALMNPSECFAFQLLVRSPDLPVLHRCTGIKGMRTGWYINRSDACAQWDAYHAPRVPWPRHKSPCAIETAAIKVTRDRLLAVKTVGERVEVILAPDRARSLVVQREVLR